MTENEAQVQRESSDPMEQMTIGCGIPGEAVAMDVGVLPWTDDPLNGYRYFLLMVDLFTWYVEVHPLRDQEADTLLNAFQQGWVYRGHGIPSIILTDKGANLDGSFHINGMVNATSWISPHQLHLGREPRSPLDVWCKHLKEGERNSYGEYLELLRKKQLELRNS